MYSIPKTENVVQKTAVEEKPVSVPKKLHLVLTIGGILLLIAAGLFILNYTEQSKNDSGNVAGVAEENRKLFEELRTIPEYSKFFNEIMRTKSHKKILNGEFTIVVVSNDNLGNGVFNIEDYILYSTFSNTSKRLVALSGKSAQLTVDGFGIKRINDREIIQERSFPSGFIIEIERKY